MRFFGRQGWGLALLLTAAVVIVAVIPKIVQAATICNACHGTGLVLEVSAACLKCDGGAGTCNGTICLKCSYCGGIGKIYAPGEREAMEAQWEAQRKAKKAQEERAKAEAERVRAEAERVRTERLKKTSGDFTDSRNNQKYRTITIDGKIWMAENLNYPTGNSWCYDDNNSNCDKYGRLYDWTTAKTACPAGFHLPSRQEWDDLGQAVGGVRKLDDNGYVEWYGTGKKLKARSSWNNNGNGTDDFGFSALPGGTRYSDGNFDAAGYDGGWWTATEYSSDFAYYQRMRYRNGNVYEDNDIKSNGYSVRCVKND
jgi:uncharacterized protein (TIGR02145 family)